MESRILKVRRSSTVVSLSARVGADKVLLSMTWEDTHPNGEEWDLGLVVNPTRRETGRIRRGGGAEAIALVGRGRQGLRTLLWVVREGIPALLAEARKVDARRGAQTKWVTAIGADAQRDRVYRRLERYGWAPGTNGEGQECMLLVL